jgi:phosphatidylglycerol lysyltransferase
MASAVQRSSVAHRLLPLVALTLFAAALWVLHDALRQFHYHHILTQLRAIPASHILAAVGSG